MLIICIVGLFQLDHGKCPLYHRCPLLWGAARGSTVSPNMRGISYFFVCSLSGSQEASLFTPTGFVYIPLPSSILCS